MITCPQCGTQNQPGAAFCDNCGASLTGVRPAAAAPAAAPVAAPVVGGGAVCPACGAAVVPGQAFCDNCGAAISAAPVAAPPVAPPAPAPAPAAPPIAPAAAGMVKCPACGQLSPAGQASCDNCGASLTGPAVAAPAPGPAVTPPSVVPPPVGMRPRLVVAATGAQFDLTGKSQVLVGREDPVSGIFPDVDLTPHGGDAGGVSRRHAKLTFTGYQWTIEDLNSTNFTWVNNQKLAPGVPQPLNHGDQVRLGKVVLTFQTA